MKAWINIYKIQYHPLQDLYVNIEKILKYNNKYRLNKSEEQVLTLYVICSEVVRNRTSVFDANLNT